MKLSHDELARSLGDHLRAPDRMVWCDMQLGPSGSPRPDVYAVFKSYVHPAPMSYECKVSVSDFRADVTSGKWQTYLAFSAGVVFACEAGLFGKGDVPEHCGLIELRGGARWRMAKRPVLRPVTLPAHVLLKLVIDGVEREGPQYRRRGWSESDYFAKMKAQHGEIAARTIRDRVAVEYEVQDRKRQAEKILADANQMAARIREEAEANVAPLRQELCEALGLPLDSDRWALQSAVGKLKADLLEHPAQAKWRRMTSALENVLSRDGFKAEKQEQIQEAS